MLTPVEISALATAEYATRAERERSKALKKYGEDALVPTGHPEYDVLDYMINELVGMVRYADMNARRFALMSKTLDGSPPKVRALCRSAAKLCDTLHDEMEAAAIEYITIRQELKRMGLQLGFTEGAA